MKESAPKWDFFSYYEEQFLIQGYDAEYIKSEFSRMREFSCRYAQEPAGDSWYKRTLLNEVFLPLLKKETNES